MREITLPICKWLPRSVLFHFRTSSMAVLGRCELSSYLFVGWDKRFVFFGYYAIGFFLIWCPC